MRLRFLAIDTGKDGCPTLYASDQDTYVIQGWRVSDAALVAELGLADGETCVEVPGRLLTFLEADGSEEAQDVELRPYRRTERGTYIIWGIEVTDSEALGQMDIPAHETVVEVPKRLMTNLAREVAWSG
jgi:hypothetical protein